MIVSSTALISEAWREELKDLATKVSLTAAAAREHGVQEHTHIHDYSKWKRTCKYVGVKCLKNSLNEVEYVKEEHGKEHHSKSQL